MTLFFFAGLTFPMPRGLISHHKPNFTERVITLNLTEEVDIAIAESIPHQIIHGRRYQKYTSLSLCQKPTHPSLPKVQSAFSESSDS
jgi:hypothetical protein